MQNQEKLLEKAWGKYKRNDNINFESKTMDSDILRTFPPYFFDRKHPVLLVQNYINKIFKREKEDEDFPS